MKQQAINIIKTSIKKYENSIKKIHKVNHIIEINPIIYINNTHSGICLNINNSLSSNDKELYDYIMNYLTIINNKHVGNNYWFKVPTYYMLTEAYSSLNIVKKLIINNCLQPRLDILNKLHLYLKKTISES